MNAQLIFAEAATQHPDGTVSMLRAGISNVRGSSPPFNLNGMLVVRILADRADHGKHDFDLACMDEDGKVGGPTLRGQFEIPTGGGVANLLLGFAMAFPKAGRYTFNLRIDNVVRGDLTITASTQPPTTKKQHGP